MTFTLEDSGTTVTPVGAVPVLQTFQSQVVPMRPRRAGYVFKRIDMPPSPPINLAFRGQSCSLYEPTKIAISVLFAEAILFTVMRNHSEMV